MKSAIVLSVLFLLWQVKIHLPWETSTAQGVEVCVGYFSIFLFYLPLRSSATQRIFSSARGRRSSPWPGGLRCTTSVWPLHSIHPLRRKKFKSKFKGWAGGFNKNYIQHLLKVPETSLCIGFRIEKQVTDAWWEVPLVACFPGFPNSFEELHSQDLKTCCGARFGSRLDAASKPKFEHRSEAEALMSRETASQTQVCR